ncbi:PA0069 family radical SAM protein [Litoribacter ruber]|uniref:PA0069 family radical SAM protein n=1 Tax=Litoribacter ruber TaxID=702568 RepID=UPI001BD97927|nr:PA0069 family radical SAM protein [Litoribacter ruber]MBT0810221.1 PA0069 family radical SAM protein [Litoribacter ruber]
MDSDKFKGRGSHIQPENRFLKRKEVFQFVEGLDMPKYEGRPVTKYFSDSVKNPLSKNDSPDLPLSFSINPYQGCEHGCIYCYARNSHTYWGFDAGLGFETNIVVKHNIVDKLKETFKKKGYQPTPIMLSGNMDCYQPAEKKFKLTRQILQTCLNYKHPVSLITKNSLVERDMDILVELAKLKLVHVYFSINHLDPGLKQVLEPRTATAEKKINLIGKFTDHGIPVGIMIAPIIPGINNNDILPILKLASQAGALRAGYTVVRLNGQLEEVFTEWLEREFPDRKEKVLHQIQSLHGGSVRDNDWGRRIKGEGPIAEVIRGIFQQGVKKYLDGRSMPEYDLSLFNPGNQLRLF